MKFHRTLLLSSTAVLTLFLFSFRPVIHANPLENWHLRHQIISPGGPLSKALHGIATTETLAVAVGGHDTILTSQDGIQWSDRSSMAPAWYTNVNPLDIAFGSNMFVAVGPNGTLGHNSMVAVSSDGVAWNVVDSGSAGALWRVAFGNGIFVAVGLAGAVATSSDGIVWTPKPRPFIDNFNELTFGNGIFVATAAGGKILTSPDGASWTLRRSGDFVNGGIAFGNGLFMVQGKAGFENFPFGRSVLTSPDGIVWTVELEVVDSTPPFSALVFGNGKFVSAYGNRVLVTLDGRTWQEASLDASVSGLGFSEGLFLAATGSGAILSSTDGLSWTERFSQENPLQMVAAGNGIFLVVGSGGTTLTSVDGIQWNLANPGLLERHHFDVTHGNGKFVSVGFKGMIATSGDGVTWVKQSSGTTDTLEKVTFGDGLFLSAGGGTVLLSGDGTDWQSIPSGLETWESITGAAFGNHTFVISTLSGTILSSRDGFTWTPVHVSASLMGVTFGNGLFVAIGPTGASYTSPDALVWTITAPERTDISITGVRHAAGAFLTTGSSPGDNRGIILISADAASWSSIVVPASPALKGIASFANTFLAVGDFTTILQSDPLPDQGCIPDIRAASSINPATIIPGENLSLAETEILSVTIGLWPLRVSGSNADWWVLADTPFGWFGYVYPDQWYPVLSIENAPPAYQGPLFSLGSLPVLTISGLPPGRYVFYFGVDLLVNGTLDASPLFYDHVVVDVGDSGF